MQIPEDKDRQIEQISSRLKDKKLSRRLRELILGWLVTEGNEEEKDRELSQMFRSVFHASRPDGEARRSFRAFVSKNNLREEMRSSAAIPLRRYAILKVAAVLALIITVSGGVFLLVREAEETAEPAPVAVMTVSAPAAGEETVTLSDGTEATVCEGGRLSYPETFAEGGRVVELQGEARFNVTKAKDGSDEFRVRTPHFDIVVLGTDFRVHSPAGNSSSTVDLYHGSVRVEAGEQAVTMTPGQHLTFDHLSAEMAVTRIPVQNLTYETMSGLLFEGSTLFEIFAAIEKEYGVDIEVKGDVKAGGEILRADLSHSRSMDELMNALSLATGLFSYEITENTIIIKPII